jgi:hypothetical protein
MVWMEFGEGIQGILYCGGSSYEIQLFPQYLGLPAGPETHLKGLEVLANIGAFLTGKASNITGKFNV